MEKVDYRHGKFTIASTDILQFKYDDYVDWCEEIDKEPQPGHSNEFWNWCFDQRDEKWECDMDNIKYCKQYNIPCVLTGCLGLYNGRPDILPIKFDNVYDAIQKCFDRSIVDLDVEWDDGIINVYAHHHDGTNCFEIHALSKKGINKFKSAENRWVDVYAENIKEWDIKRLPYIYAIGVI